MLGIVLSGVVAAALPPTFFEQYLSNELASMLVMLLISIPIYVCASEATPVAAALVLKGLNPGAALVFLLAGPATNIGSIVVLTKFLGARIMAIYLGSIVVVALLAGHCAQLGVSDLGDRSACDLRRGDCHSFRNRSRSAAHCCSSFCSCSACGARDVPGEWMWLRDRFARLHRTAADTSRAWRWRLVMAVAAPLPLAADCSRCHRARSACARDLAASSRRSCGPGLHYRLPWPFEAHRIVPKDRVQRIEFGIAGNQAKAARRARPVASALSAGGIHDAGRARAPAERGSRRSGAPRSLSCSPATATSSTCAGRCSTASRTPVAFAFNVAEPDAFVRGASLAALRGVVARSGIDAIYTSERSSVERQVARAIQRYAGQNPNRSRDPVLPSAVRASAGRGPRRVPRRRQRAGRQAAHDQSRQHLRGGDR